MSDVFEKTVAPFLLRDYAIVSRDNSIDWDRLSDRSILVTGATGEIGREIVKTLLFVEKEKHLGLKIFCLARSKEKAERLFGSFLSVYPEILRFVYGSISSFTLDEPVDCIIHTASPTASAFFVTNPVETIQTIVEGTFHTLEFARKKSVSSLVFLSSMEIYGEVQSDNVREENLGKIALNVVRSSYPEAKRLAELLCFSYFEEYGVPSRIVRLTQTFGTHLSGKDNRVYAQFARAARRGENIILHTQGKTRRDYLYTIDAVRAILAILTRGQNGTTYNVSNPKSFLSIREMAELAASFNPKSQVQINEDDGKARGYAPTVEICLNNDRINALAPFERTSIETMFHHLIVDLPKVDSE